MRNLIQNLSESKIREVANAGLGKSDVLAFWFGESDEVTPEIVTQAAVESLRAGETFYAHNLGLPQLRQSIALYLSALHLPIGQERIAVTAGGVNALMLASQALVDAGDEVVAITPVWPNLLAQPRIMGAVVREISLQPNAQGAWCLEMTTLLAAITSKTKLLILNAPNNPTGWTLSQAEQLQILEHCRKTGTWILADEVYERLYYLNDTKNGCAPSFLDIADEQDRLIVVGSMSKSFLMTGWRVGWMVLPLGMSAQVGKLIEFNTSCNATFVQRAAVAAFANEKQITPRVVAHLKNCRDTLSQLLGEMAGIQHAPSPGGMYAFFKIRGLADSLQTAKRLVSEASLGLAPGAAFSEQSEAWLRWCFASKDIARLHEGAKRLSDWLDSTKN